MAYSFKGSISFGLVYIPIKLETVVVGHDIGFNQLEKSTMSRVRYKKTCDDCDGKTIEQKDIIKAYEYEKDRYVVFEDAELEKIKSKRDKTVSIEQFVSLSEIDPIYFDKAYYVIPQGAEKAYSLLKSAMEKENTVGIAKTVLGTRDTLIALRVKDGQMLLYTLHFFDEIRPFSFNFIEQAASKQEEDLAAMIIKNMSAPFEIEKYRDEYTGKVREAIEAKVAGKEITTPSEAHSPKVADLMEALQQSLAMSNNAANNPSPEQSWTQT